MIKGIACPHFDEELEREPYVYKMLEKQIIKSCICLEGNCALHIQNESIYSSIDFGKGKKCLVVSYKNNEFKKEYF